MADLDHETNNCRGGGYAPAQPSRPLECRSECTEQTCPLVGRVCFFAAQEEKKEPLMLAKFELIAPCFFGCESTAKFELNCIGAENIRVRRPPDLLRRCGDDGSQPAPAHRGALCRCCWPAKASTFDELFDGVYSVPWEDLLPADAAFPVTGSLDSQLPACPPARASSKKAVVKRPRPSTTPPCCRRAAPSTRSALCCARTCARSC